MEHVLNPTSSLFDYVPSPDDPGSCLLDSQPLVKLIRAHVQQDLTRFCPLDVQGAEKAHVVEALTSKRFSSASEDRAVGCLLGLVVGDALGAPMEFRELDHQRADLNGMEDPAPWRKNRFHLKPGQWTDDASMALCLADTCLCRHGLDLVDSMLRYLGWWHFGYNNAFGYDETMGCKRSVGLGGNISQAMARFLTSGEGITRAGDKHTSGNGSLMRLAPISVWYHDRPGEALIEARRSSLVTHQGDQAAECCRLLAHICVTAIHAESPRDVLNDLSQSFTSSDPSVSDLSRGDGAWSWKSPSFRYDASRAQAQPRYIGSYAMDGLAMALHCVSTSSSLEEAMLKSANLGGDADTVTAITGQIAGAIHGASSIPSSWWKTTLRWDPEATILVRAWRLFHHQGQVP